MARWQERRGRLFVIENPAASRARKQPALTSLVEDYGITTFDMCTLDFKDPYRGKPLKKRTGIVTNFRCPAVNLKQQRCTCQEQYRLVFGNAETQQEDGSWRSTSLAEFVGCYTAKTEQTLLHEAYADLVAWTCPRGKIRRTVAVS